MKQQNISAFYPNPQKAGKKELNRISWNGAAPKYDIREWAPGREKMGKGVTLSEEEFNELQQLLKNI